MVSAWEAGGAVGEPNPFFFLHASSGAGKTQLASSLDVPVVYLPLSHGQMIYKPFQALWFGILEALSLKEDWKMFDSENAMDEIRSAESLFHSSGQFHTVGLLVELFKLVYGKTNEESIRLLSGMDGQVDIPYQPMALYAARDFLKPCMSHGQDESGRCTVPLFILDEVPCATNQYLYEKCILLRNLLRCMGCVCLLSGTEAAAMKSLDIISYSSRGQQSREYMRLITALPPTAWSAFENDDKYAALIATLSDDVCRMLQRTRPLFVEYVLDAMLELRAAGEAVSDKAGALTVSVLRTAKRRVLTEKFKFTSKEGLFAQLALLNPSLLPSTAQGAGKRKPLTNKLLQEAHQEAEFCVRDHFGVLKAPNQKGDANSSPLPVYLEPSFNRFDDEEEQEDELNSSCLMITSSDGTSEPFLPCYTFAPPDEDPLLYLICMRDGVNYGDNRKRVSTSYGLRTIHEWRLAKGTALLDSTDLSASVSADQFFEREVMSASVVASHLYKELSGCPLSFFLTALVAELNVNAQYVSPEALAWENMPACYEDIKVGLLSPAQAPWHQGDSVTTTPPATSRTVQNGTILLSNCEWSANTQQHSSVQVPLSLKGESAPGTLEIVCDTGKMSTATFQSIIKNHTDSGRTLTIVVAADSTSTNRKSAAFRKAKQGPNVIRVSGNASKEQRVASTLKWESLNSAEGGESAENTVIQVVLESIYFGRAKAMEDTYKPK